MSCFLFVTILNLNCIASEVAKSSGSLRTSEVKSSSGFIAELGGCKPQKHPKTNTEEAFARAEAEKADLSKEELLARLIYSESLSTGYWNGRCNSKSEEDIMTAIGWGIMNRVKGKAKSSLDPYSKVIFARRQFSTSFSTAKTNPFAEAFLCPLKSEDYLSKALKKASATELFKKSQKIANDVITEYEKSGLPKKYKGITYIFYPQSEYSAKRQSWAKNDDPTKNKGYFNILDIAEAPCVEAYRL